MFLFSLLLALGLQAGAAQETPHLEISTVRYFADRDGGWRISTWRALVNGQPVREAVYNFEKGCGFIYGQQVVPQGALTGWTIEATPLEVAADHVRLHVVWSREADNGVRLNGPRREATILLRPGDVLSLDSAVLPRCQNSLATFVIALKGEAPGRLRIASTDLWLVHREPDGKENIQQLNVRSEFGERGSLAFDSMRIGALTIDVAAAVTPRSVTGDRLELQFNTVRSVRGVKGHYGGGFTVLRLAADDVISIALPLPAGEGFEPLAAHTLSIRVRSRQIR